MKGYDVKLNSTYVWNGEAGPSCPGNAWDMWSIASHELGHVAGLMHCNELYDQNTMDHEAGNPGCIKMRHLEMGDIQGAIYQSGFVGTGKLPFTQVWMSYPGNTSLQGNVYVGAGDSLFLSVYAVIPLGNYDIVSSGGFLGYYNGTTMGNTGSGKCVPHISIIKSDGTVKGFYHSLSTAIDSLSTGGAGAYIYVGSDCTIDSGVTVSIPSNTTIK